MVQRRKEEGCREVPAQNVWETERVKRVCLGGLHWVSCFIVEFSNPDTNWGEESVTFSEVPSFERLYKSGILPVGKGALFREMSSIQGSF